jgi:hypothetical protein
MNSLESREIYSKLYIPIFGYIYHSLKSKRVGFAKEESTPGTISIWEILRWD